MRIEATDHDGFHDSAVLVVVVAVAVAGEAVGGGVRVSQNWYHGRQQ